MIIFVRKIFRFIIYIAITLYHKVVVIANLYEYYQTSDSPCCDLRIEGYFKVIDNIAELEAYKENFTSSQYELYKKRLIKFKDKMLVFVTEGKLAYWVFFTVSRDRYYEREVEQEMIIPQHSALLYNGFTKGEYRRKGIHAAKYLQIFQFLEKFDKKKIVFLIITRNRAAMENAKKFNFKVIKKLVLINLGIFKLRFNINL